jgi:hypothetical protein
LRFVGDYATLKGGLISNAALMLSGGICDIYHLEMIRNASKKVKRIKNSIIIADNIPNFEELFEIVRIAIEKNEIVGTSSADVKTFSLIPPFRFLLLLI